jgi:hypothetical protein
MLNTMLYLTYSNQTIDATQKDCEAQNQKSCESTFNNTK